MTGQALLRRLRELGFSIRTDGGDLLLSPASRLTDALKREVTDNKPAVLAALRQEEIELVLDLVAVDPETGLPDLPADLPATDRQVQRLHELAGHPAFGDHRTRVGEIVDRALAGGLSQLAAYALIGDLGRRISERERKGVQV